MVGYMVTWTVYGSWLQGDRRGYVKDGEILEYNPAIQKANRKALGHEPVYLNKRQQRVVKEAIEKDARKIGQVILALAACRDHVHVVVENNGMEAGHVVRRYKNAGWAALRQEGWKKRVWTNGYDKRYCFDRKQLQNRIQYVERH